MRLIVGLGNPGRKYDGTPHNLGFDVVDILADRAGAQFRSARKFKALVADGVLAGKKTVLLKPLTYMNLSGESVQAFLRYHPLEPDQLLVVTDDVNLPAGRMRFREGGSHGGHNGLLSLIRSLGSDDFPRLRIGVYPREGQIPDLVRYVLTPFWGESREIMNQMRPLAADAVEEYLREGFQAAAGNYNVKDPLGLDEDEEKK